LNRRQEGKEKQSEKEENKKWPERTNVWMQIFPRCEISKKFQRGTITCCIITPVLLLLPGLSGWRRRLRARNAFRTSPPPTTW
jgi:hypothetical protein